MAHQNEALANLMERLVEQNWLVISIRRRNIIERVLSEAVLFTTRKPHSYGQSMRSDEAIYIDPELFQRLLEQDRILTAREAKLLSHIPHITLIYEEDLAHPQQWSTSTARVLTFLDVPVIPLTTKMVKTWEDPYEKLVSNYAELVQIVRTGSHVEEDTGNETSSIQPRAKCKS